MPFITVKMFPGRTEDQKRALVAEVTKAVSKTIGARKESITVFIEEMEPSDYAVGGKLFNDQ